MKRTTLITTLVAITPMLASVRADAAQQKYHKSSKLAFADVPPAAWQEQDPAVGLYRQARARLNDGDYKGAAELFGRIIARYPRSEYTPDAYYWQAFALYRNEDYKQAKQLLERQKARYPNAATARDAASLLARVNGALAARGDSNAAEDVVVSASGRQCSKDPELQAAALNALLQMNAEQAIPMLKQILARTDECAVELRRKAVFLVSQKRGPEVEDILLSAARRDPDKEVREQAVFWLSQVGTERAVDYLEDLLSSSRDRDIQDKAIFALSQHRSERAGQIIRQYAQNQNAPRELREKAIFALSQRRGMEGVLKELYERERDPELKNKILFGLSQQRGNEPFLLEIATSGNENMEVRKQALFWAGQSKGTSFAQLSRLYDRMQERELKEQLIFVYSQRHEREAVDKLMQIARTEPDRELRKKAIFWLSQSKDPRVAQFLMDLINN